MVLPLFVSSSSSSAFRSVNHGISLTNSFSTKITNRNPNHNPLPLSPHLHPPFLSSPPFLRSLIMDEHYRTVTVSTALKEAFMASISMKNHHLLWYLEKHLSLNGSMELTTEPCDSVHHLPWNRETCLFVLTYVVHFCSNVDHSEFSPIIMALDQIAECVHELCIKQHDQVRDGGDDKRTHNQEDCVDEIIRKRHEFSQMLVNSFLPNVVPAFFKVPKLDQLPEKDKHLKPNDILASFLDFLLQVLHRESNVGNDEEQRHTLDPVRKQLSFLLAVLGDAPFQFNNHELAEEVGDLMAEFEILANEAGILVYDCVFHIHLVKTFDARVNALSGKLELLNSKIKEHCIKFAELLLSGILRPGVVDSFFIIHSLIVDIENLMNNRLNVSHGDFIKNQVETLHDELIPLQSFINVSHVPNEQKETLIEIRDLAYEVEYLISSYVVGNMDVWYLSLRLPSLIQKIELCHLGLQQSSEMYDSKVISAFDNEVSFRRTEDPVTMDDNYFVDFSSDITQKILEDLVGKVGEEEEDEEKEEEEEQSSYFVSIVGMPGIGKTTIATKLYNSREASSHFDVRAWCVVSETYSVRDMLIQILVCIESNPDKNTISKKNVEELRKDIQKILSGKRFLIVVDDVWDFNLFNDWECFPENGNGSRVLITTQIELESCHKLPFLSDDQCWDLLVKKVFLNNPCPPGLLSIGKKIARRCSGIPLVVVSTADILVTLEKEISVWETVEEQLDTLLLDGQSNYTKNLELRYKHLPHYLRPCFLYFATFPKDTKISKDQLGWMWIAQGYIQKEEKMSQEETAGMYLSDMINRGLVLDAKRGTGCAMKTVKIHDMLHEFCVRKANEENFHSSTNDFSMYEKHQHLSLPSASSGISLRPFGFRCRSLRGCPAEQLSCFQTMPLLKVMDLSPNENGSLLYERFDLPVQLKYLGVSDLPNAMVDNLVDLECLHVRSNKKVLVPSSILRRPKLRHVLIKPSAEFEEDCNIPEASYLRSLSFVCIYRQKEAEMLRHLPYLHKLKFMCGGDVIFPDMSFLTELESLKICFGISSRDIKVPNFNLPPTLKKLCLSGAILTGENMSIIGNLPNLLVLKLQNHSVVGDVWDSGYFDFQELRVLKIESRDLRVWINGHHSFGKLECLVVTGCTKLEEIPTFSLTECLERIEVTECGPRSYLSAAARISGVKLVTDKNMEQLVMQDIELHDRETVDTSSIEELSIYLKEHMPRNWDGCQFVVNYVMQFHSSEFQDVVMGLVCIVRSYQERKDRLQGYSCWSYETEKKQGEFSELFVNSFIPKVQKFFNVLKSHWSGNDKKDKHVKPNEILAAFLSFLIQILHCEEKISHSNPLTRKEQFYTLLRNQLSFHLAVLGDLPFQLTHPGFEEEVDNILEEFESLANDAGSFIHSCVFSIHPVDTDWFYAETVNLIVKAELLNDGIKHHCKKFSELPMSAISRSAVVHSFFIFDSLIQDIENLENREINFIDGDEKMNQIGMLKDELNASKIITKVTDQITKHTDANEEKGLIQIRDLAYQAEYLINSHVVGNIPAWYLNLRLPSIVKEIRVINGTLRQGKKMLGGNVITKGSDREESSRALANASTVIDSDLLPFNDDTVENILVDLFRSSIPSRKIISLSGMPGLGKTTTATMLYNRPEISGYFDQRAWCVVSQSYSLTALFVHILNDISPENKPVLGKETTELGVSIHKALYGRRYLIVLDDVWESGVLDQIIRYLPGDTNGSRVIVTSRDTSVVPGDSIFHTLPLLSRDQCWDLLKKKVFLKESCPSQFEDVGKKIAEKCCGISLAVVTTAGILSNLEKETSVWQSVERQLDGLLLDDQNGYRKILELSYEHLPRNLKPCFLYFARFPEDCEISTEMLTWMWISERFIPIEEKKSPEEIAEMYFLDLINRSLVMPAARSRSNGGIRTCRIHDLLHDICVAKASEENLVKTTNIFPIHEKQQGFRPFDIRCLSFRDYHIYQAFYFRTMALLKTVELPPQGSYVHYPIHLRYDLPVQLRYLGGQLDKSMVANLVNLEFIHVRSKERRILIPSVILRMVKLRHLLIRRYAVFGKDCNTSEELNLRSLSYVHIRTKKHEDILRHSPHLQKLKCEIGGDEISFPDLSDLTKLESLRIDYDPIYFWGKVLLSEGSFPSTIKRLCLKESILPWEKMSIIGRLPMLEVLKLENDAFVGEKWETNDDEFQKLRFLKLEAIYLGKWTSESSHFPNLEQLVMNYCHNLEEIPGDLGYIQSLQKIVVQGCGEGVISSAKDIEDEQRDNGNTQLQVLVSSAW